MCCNRKTAVEMTSLHANKTIALKWLTEKMGLKMEEVLAIGDSNNDVDMLRTAGIGVAVEMLFLMRKGCGSYHYI